jgi:hypothetical protein
MANGTFKLRAALAAGAWVATAMLPAPPRPQTDPPKAQPETAAAAGWIRADLADAADAGSAINAAEQSCQQGGCTIALPAGEFRYWQTIKIDRPMVIRGAGPAATNLQYMGPGDAVWVQAGPGAAYITGGIFDLAITAQDPTAVGIRQTDTIGFRYDEDEIAGFKVGLEIENAGQQSCGQCSQDWDALTSVGKVSFMADTTGIELTAERGAETSFGYTEIAGAHFQIPPGGTALLLDSGARLYNSYLRFYANASAPSTVIAVTGGAQVESTICDVAAEAYPGPAGPGTKFLRLGAGSTFYASGRCGELGGSNSIASGAKYRLVRPATPPSSGTGRLVLTHDATIINPVIVGPTLIAANVPPGASFTSEGSADLSLGSVSLPSSVSAPGGALRLPPGPTELVGADTTQSLANKSLISPRIGTQTIGSPPHPFLSAYIAGPLTSKRLIAEWVPDQPQAVTRVVAVAATPPAGCQQEAVLEVAQGQHRTALQITAAVSDSGPISLTLAPAIPVTISIGAGAVCRVRYRPGGESTAPTAEPTVPGAARPRKRRRERAARPHTAPTPPSNVSVVVQLLAG